jgi:hypothetical protein
MIGVWNRTLLALMATMLMGCPNKPGPTPHPMGVETPADGSLAPPASSAVDPIELTGRYRLISVNGVKIPGEVQHGQAVVWIHSGTFVIKADGTCSSRSVFEPPGTDRKVIREVSATYTRDATRLTMQWKGAGRTVGKVDGDIFTMDNHGMIFRYGRQ